MSVGSKASPKRIFATGLVGFLAGLINALLGAAGGILLVYAMPHLLKVGTPTPVPFVREITPLMEVRDRIATSMSVMLPITAVSLVLYWISGVPPTLSALTWLAIPAAVGGLCGAWLLGRIQANLLRRLFAVIVIISGFRMLF